MINSLHSKINFHRVFEKALSYQYLSTIYNDSCLNSPSIPHSRHGAGNRSSSWCWTVGLQTEDSVMPEEQVAGDEEEKMGQVQMQSACGYTSVHSAEAMWGPGEHFTPSFHGFYRNL